MAVLGILLLAGIAGVVGANPAAAEQAAAVAASDASTAAQQLALAGQSLASGQGPAAGQDLSCSLLAANYSSCTAAVSATTVTTTAFWNEEQAPGAREGPAFTYDGKDRYDLMFGGWNNSAGYLGDTWEEVHSEWINLPQSHGPSARSNASMTYDANAKDGYVVLFGGQNASGFLDDTWTFVKGVWTEVCSSCGPSARAGASITYDSHDGYVLLYGGHSTSGPLSDTWKFVGGTWSELFPSSSPSPRWGAAMTYDGKDGYTVLFGGYSGSGYLGDTWEYESGGWTPLSPSPSPPARAFAGLVYANYKLINYTVLYGGVGVVSSQRTDYGDTWEFLAGAWTKLSPTIAPEARDSAAIAWDGSDNAVVVFSGSTDGNPLEAQDSWEYLYNTTTTQIGWKQQIQTDETEIEEPSARYGAAFAPDAGTENGDLLFGGSTADGPNDQTWQFTTPGSLKANYWFEQFPTVSPSARTYASMVWDGADGYVLMFGGMSPSGAALGDTWEYKAGVWTQLNPSVMPPARYGAGMAYDSVDGEVVLFGGTNGAQYLSDTWTYKGGTWTELNLATSPSPVAFAGMAWDPALNYVVLYGGTNGMSASAATWKFLGNTWTQLHPKGEAPPAEWGMTLVTDPKDNYTYMFGGCSASSFNPLSPSCPSADVQGITWKYKGNFTSFNTTGHNQPAPIGTPAPRYLAAGAFWYPVPKQKEVDEYTVLLDGISAQGTLLQQRYGFVAAIYSLWYPDPLPVERYGALESQDVRDQQALMFGGIGPVSGGGLGYLDDTWMWDTGVWGAVNSPNNPSPRAFGAESSWYPNLPKFQTECLSTCFTLIFGGVGPTKYGTNGYLGDTWKYEGSPWGGHWSEVSAGGGPSPRANSSMIFDNLTQQIILFGGQGPNGLLGDTWSWTLSAGWQQLNPANSPPPMEGMRLAYDSEDKYLILFGGLEAGGVYNPNTWIYQGGSWSILSTPGGEPSPRVGFGFMDSPKPAGYGFVLLEGGYGPSGYLGDTWVFLGGTWTEQPTRTASFVPVAWAAVADDWDDGHPNFFSGMTAGGISNDFWEFKKGP